MNKQFAFLSFRNVRQNRASPFYWGALWVQRNGRTWIWLVQFLELHEGTQGFSPWGLLLIASFMQAPKTHHRKTCGEYEGKKKTNQKTKRETDFSKTQKGRRPVNICIFTNTPLQMSPEDSHNRNHIWSIKKYRVGEKKKGISIAKKKKPNIWGKF